MKALVYVGFAGSGWVLDMALFWCLVSAGLAPGLANLVSASIAAMTVYWAAQRFLFGATTFSGRRFLTYLAYTEANIVFWAFVIQLLAGFLWDKGWLPAETSAALAAKVLVTPLSLASNYLVTRFLAQGQR